MHRCAKKLSGTFQGTFCGTFGTDGNLYHGTMAVRASKYHLVVGLTDSKGCRTSESNVLCDAKHLLTG